VIDNNCGQPLEGDNHWFVCVMVMYGTSFMAGSAKVVVFPIGIKDSMDLREEAHALGAYGACVERQ